LLLLAVLGVAWEPLGQVGTAGLLVPALWFAALPAACAWTQAFRLLAWLTGGTVRAALGTAAALALAGLATHATVAAFAQRCTGTTPLKIGLSDDQRALADTLRRYTSPEARILWEDRSAVRETSRWAVLLPVLTERVFMGGLEPGAVIEHTKLGLAGQSLEGRPLAEWSDAALEEYCRRYNVAWVVCWSPAVVERFRVWQDGAVELARVIDDGTPGRLFALKRPARSYALKGQATVVHADAHHITLADVVPEDGRVVLSLHYQAGMRASPSRVQVERELDPYDPIPFVRLRVAAPVARVTLTWGDR
jgi:hypothetical protein